MEDFRWIYKEDERQVAEVSADLLSGANPSRFSANRNYRKDGAVIHCEWYHSSLVDASGRLRSILSLVLDVTERRRAEEQLRQRNRTLRAHNDSSHALISAEDERSYLEAVCRIVVNDCGHAMAWIRLRLDLEPVSLSVVTAVPSGLLLNELVINCLKHAFPGRSEGEITVRLRASPAGRVCLSVSDNGLACLPGWTWRSQLRWACVLSRCSSANWMERWK
jgi:signal transduction histidine kinase